ncbi:MAG TPA: 4-alpha-glucanotransferase [Bacteroidales bacterium]|nr:4-alpha-glucanotransferase [Bacteroidales bacterium]
MKYQRGSGILLHPSSLPGSYGIGTLGKEAMEFIDFLSHSRQQYWQILPLGPTGFADSPYQCFSSFAGNPLLINLDLLIQDNLLKSADLDPLRSFGDGPVDFGKLTLLKYPVLKKAAVNFLALDPGNTKQPYRDFIDQHQDWLNDYALFMALKAHFDLKPWYVWDKPLKERDPEELEKYRIMLKEEILFHQVIQYLFFSQWKCVKAYANQQGITIIGDIPLYVAMDSADAWMNPDLFEFDDERNPIAVGGVPPDYFSETGQLWGNPLFRWETHKNTGYSWWINRIKGNLLLYDVIRIDHFRGFAAFWSIPYGEPTAIHGQWIPGPGKDLFRAIFDQLGDIPIIAEDLGVITDDVIDLRDSFDLPGMKILQFAFDSGEENDYLPHNYPKNCIVYTGTHDNDTVTGWFGKARDEDRRFVMAYLHSDGQHISEDFIRAAFSSVANTAIIPMQDLLGLNTEARMNLPGTTVNNWRWRLKPGQISEGLSSRLAEMTKLYGRDHRRENN